MKMDNQTTMGIANESIKPKSSKPVAMRYHWVQDQVREKNFNIFWKPGSQNYADHPSKHHPAHHHVKVRGMYIHQANSLLRGCVNMQSCQSSTNSNVDILRTIQQCIDIRERKYTPTNDDDAALGTATYDNMVPYVHI